MSYCLGMLLDVGLVFMSDTRTNAGIDNISTFRKTFIFDAKEDRRIVILVAGNLAITQNVLSRLEERLEDDDVKTNIYSQVSMFDVARLVGATLREVHGEEADALKNHDVDFSASLIVGGQIKGRRMRLFNIYSAGNFVEATAETPYFQIGEAKYGKPIIERVITPQLSIAEAVKCGLVSFNSTIRSNLSVGLPIDLTFIPRDNFEGMYHHLILEDDPYFNSLGDIWGQGLRDLFSTLPDPEWIR
ncbi:Proteasome-type protease [Candidatus Terasakiella magnetica]|uniref:Proteasome-type protease n=1 Tax=Candidatus Terasakiella magnetica TaxID=1867952 RepID=A0A1C3RKV3_9PROT|nr:peptidase [Candidatus Terasakiella magnetica]SCA57952.1 Proteasome-type protease [Candidatus Terasakiella magnetica]